MDFEILRVPSGRCHIFVVLFISILCCSYFPVGLMIILSFYLNKYQYINKRHWYVLPWLAMFYPVLPRFTTMFCHVPLCRPNDNPYFLLKVEPFKCLSRFHHLYYVFVLMPLLHYKIRMCL